MAQFVDETTKDQIIKNKISLTAMISNLQAIKSQYINNMENIFRNFNDQLDLYNKMLDNLCQHDFIVSERGFDWTEYKCTKCTRMYNH